MYIIETHPASLWLWLCVCVSSLFRHRTVVIIFRLSQKLVWGKSVSFHACFDLLFLFPFSLCLINITFLLYIFFLFLFRTDSGAEILHCFFQIFCEIILQCECVYLCARGEGVYVSRVQPSIKS